jgi:hypothetical protein
MRAEGVLAKGRMRPAGRMFDMPALDHRSRINSYKSIPQEQSIFKNFINVFPFSGTSCYLPQYAIYESTQLSNAP